MKRSECILKRVSRAVDRAVVQQTPTGADCWAVGWSRAYRAALRRESLFVQTRLFHGPQVATSVHLGAGGIGGIYPPDGHPPRFKYPMQKREIFARPKAVFRSPEKQVSGIWVSVIENAVFNLG
jgi:hypothetical protein